MRDGELEGMQPFDKVIEGYIRSGLITIQDGLAYSSNPGNLQLAISDLTDPAASEPPPPPASRRSGAIEKLPDGFER